jgi:hypothetical protein
VKKSEVVGREGHICLMYSFDGKVKEWSWMSIFP